MTVFPNRKSSRDSLSRRCGARWARLRRSRVLGTGVGLIMLIGLLVVALGRSRTGLRSPSHAYRAAAIGGDDGEEESLLALLESRVEAAEASLKEHAAALQKERLEAAEAIARLEAQLKAKGESHREADKADVTRSQPPPYPRAFNDAGPYAECEARFGLGLADHIRQSRVTVCSEPEGAGPGGQASSMECYPFVQQHKRHRPDRKWDMFCVAENFMVDFSKVGGTPATKVESHSWRQGAYHSFQQGSLSATCKPTAAYRDLADKFMPHHGLQMQSFTPGVAPPAADAYVVEEAPTYLLARDEDCENLFHSMADHMNIYLVVEHVLNMSFEDLAVVLFDRHVEGPFYEMIQRAFSPNHPLKRAHDFKGQKVLFRKLIFHLESPAGIIFPAVGAGSELPCFSSSYYHAFRRHILKSFDLWDIPPPPVPTVVFSVRRRTPQKNLGRILKNEDGLVNLLKQGNMIKYQVVDLATMTFKEQLKVMRNCNIYIGVHGAGLMHAYFLAEEAIVMEIHPSYRLDRHFRIATRQSGKIYMPLRLTTEIDCEGSSDNLRVDLDEFRIALDGAVRIARSFEKGVAECGLTCNPGVPALDSHLDPHYGSAVGIAHKSHRLHTQFPCA